MKTRTKVDYLARFQPGVHYHVYNRTNNRESLFLRDDNRRFFLDQYKKYLADYVDTFCWCLMKNHFHLSIRVKSAPEIVDTVKSVAELDRTAAQRMLLSMAHEERDFHEVIERQFMRWFTSYAMAFNKQQLRSGNLFYRPFKRVAVMDQNHLTWLTYYIHSNVTKHGVRADFTQYPWSSYPAFLSEKPTLLCKQEVLDWFGGLDGFVSFHQPNAIIPEQAAFFHVEDNDG